MASRSASPSSLLASSIYTATDVATQRGAGFEPTHRSDRSRATSGGDSSRVAWQCTVKSGGSPDNSDLRITSSGEETTSESNASAAATIEAARRRQLAVKASGSTNQSSSANPSGAVQVRGRPTDMQSVQTPRGPAAGAGVIVPVAKMPFVPLVKVFDP